jgi:sulfite reductase alpha subunit-like flavoprotein
VVGWMNLVKKKKEKKKKKEIFIYWGCPDKSCNFLFSNKEIPDC